MPKLTTQSSRLSRSHTIRYKIEASRCDLRVGDRVAPGTVIGNDHDTGRPITAEYHGEVEAVGFSGGEHSLIVMIRTFASI